MSHVACRVTIFAVSLYASTVVQAAVVTFDFEADAVGKTTPFTDTVGGLSATFGGSASVCASSNLFVSLTGNVLIQAFCGPVSQSGPLSIDFSSDLSHFDLNFATAGGAGILTLSALENSTAVGTATFTSAVPAGHFNGEGTASFNGTFNRVVLSTSGFLALDNANATVTAVPEPEIGSTVFVGLAGCALLVALRRAQNKARPQWRAPALRVVAPETSTSACVPYSGQSPLSLVMMYFPDATLRRERALRREELKIAQEQYKDTRNPETRVAYLGALKRFADLVRKNALVKRETSPSY